MTSKAIKTNSSQICLILSKCNLFSLLSNIGVTLFFCITNNWKNLYIKDVFIELTIFDSFDLLSCKVITFKKEGI